MKNTIRIATVATSILLALGLAPGSAGAARGDDGPKLSGRTSALLADLHCKHVKSVRNDSTLEDSGDVAVTCRVKRSWGTQTFYVRRFKSGHANLDPWVKSLASGTSAWGQPREASCLVKKGRHLVVPMGVRGEVAKSWCSYANRRVGGMVIQGS